MPTLRIEGSGSSTYCYLTIGTSTTKHYSDGYSRTVEAGTNITVYVKSPGSAYNNDCFLDVEFVLGRVIPTEQTIIYLFNGDSISITFQMPKTNLAAYMSYSTTEKLCNVQFTPEDCDSFNETVNRILIDGTSYGVSVVRMRLDGASRFVSNATTIVNGSTYLVPLSETMVWLRKTSESESTGEYLYEKSYYYPAYGEYSGYWYELQPRT